MKIKDTENIIILGIYLAIISAIAASTLAVVYKKTKPAIDLAKAKAASAKIIKIIPDFNNNPMKDKIIEKSVIDPKRKIKFYPAKFDGTLVAIVAESAAAGYKGDVKVLTSFTCPKLSIDKIIVSEHNETPGIGTKVVSREVKKMISDIGKKKNDTGLAPNEFLDDPTWNKLSTEGKVWNEKSQWKVKKDGGQILEITGATISSRAVTNAVYAAIATLKSNQAAILKRINSKNDK